MLRHTLRAFFGAPEPILRPLTGPAHVNHRGHALDLGVHAFLRTVARARGTVSTRPLAHLRREMDERAPLADFARHPELHVEDRVVASATHAFPVRVYRPIAPGAAPLPVCVYFHGGGFCTGSVRSHDGLCSRIAARAGCIVVSVEYRLAPEHRFPAAVDDAIAAFRWTTEHAGELGGDRARIAVAGDSAGGNLATVVALSERERAVHPCFQLLVYPTTDFRSHETNDSFRLYGRGFLHETDATLFFRSHYLGGCAIAARDPRASVLHAPDAAGIAPAHVVTAGFDPLRDEGERYAEKLALAGVPVTHRCEEHLVHGFFSLGGILPAAARATDRAIDALAVALHAA